MRHLFRIVAAIFVLVVIVSVLLLGTWRGGVLAAAVGLVTAVAADWILGKILDPDT